MVLDTKTHKSINGGYTMKKATSADYKRINSLVKTFTEQPILEKGGINEIIIYACKTTRKNSKHTNISVKSFGGLPDTKLKRLFKDDDIRQIVSFLVLNDYSYYRISVFYKSKCLKNFYSTCYYSMESVLLSTKLFMDLINSDSFKY